MSNSANSVDPEDEGESFLLERDEGDNTPTSVFSALSLESLDHQELEDEIDEDEIPSPNPSVTIPEVANSKGPEPTQPQALSRPRAYSLAHALADAAFARAQRRAAELARIAREVALEADTIQLWSTKCGSLEHILWADGGRRWSKTTEVQV